MSQLIPAREDQIEAIMRESHGLWGAGLTFEGYQAMWAELRATPWARQFLTHRVWVSDTGTVLSSMKLYRPLVRLLGKTSRAAAIGAVFTPRAQRGRGHASAMLRAALAEARIRGDGLALLFSDIGTSYYEALGFRSLPAEEAAGSLGKRGPLAPKGWVLRPMMVEDLDAIRGAHEAWCVSRPLAVIRDRSHWDFLLARARCFFSRVDGSDLAWRYRVAVRDGAFAGYLIAVEGDGEWNLREVGTIGSYHDAAVAILRAGAAEARRAGLRSVRGWFPREIAKLVPEWHLGYSPRRGAIPMILSLDGTTDLSGLSDVHSAFLPYIDQF